MNDPRPDKNYRGGEKKLLGGRLKAGRRRREESYFLEGGRKKWGRRDILVYNSFSSLSLVCVYIYIYMFAFSRINKVVRRKGCEF